MVGTLWKPVGIQSYKIRQLLQESYTRVYDTNHEQKKTYASMFIKRLKCVMQPVASRGDIHYADLIDESQGRGNSPGRKKKERETGNIY